MFDKAKEKSKKDLKNAPKSFSRIVKNQEEDEDEEKEDIEKDDEEEEKID